MGWRVEVGGPRGWGGGGGRGRRGRREGGGASAEPRYIGATTGGWRLLIFNQI